VVARYQLFVDDSGTREYDDNKNYTTSGKSLYFAYGAILVEQNVGSQLVPRLRKLKRLLFGTADVEVKSNWLRMPHERVRRYIQPFGITEQALTQFTDDYYSLMVKAPIVLLGSVVNKLQMQEKYAQPWYAPTAAYEWLMQRAVQAVPDGSRLSVTIDDISGKTPKNNKYKEMVAKHHARLRARGSSLQPEISFECLDGPARFVLSHHSDMIQAADLVSYCVQRQFRDYGDEWETPSPDGGSLPMYPYFERISDKFRRDAAGRVQGFGIVKAPLIKRVRWVVTKEKRKKK
jgi:uncharacterized protein DUF3800